MCVECLFLRTPSRAPYRTPPACAKRATYSAPNCFQSLGSSRACYRVPYCEQGDPVAPLGQPQPNVPERKSHPRDWKPLQPRFPKTPHHRRAADDSLTVCVECLVGKQNKPTLFKVTEPSSVPSPCVCVDCLFLRSPSRIPYRTELIPRAPKGRRTRTPHPSRFSTLFFGVLSSIDPLGKKIPRYKILNLRFFGKL